MANQFGVALIFWAFYVSALALLDIFGYTDSPDEKTKLKSLGGTFALAIVSSALQRAIKTREDPIAVRASVLIIAANLAAFATDAFDLGQLDPESASAGGFFGRSTSADKPPSALRFATEHVVATLLGIVLHYLLSGLSILRTFVRWRFASLGEAPAATSKRRILILYANIGSGHKMAALALEAAFKLRNAPNLEVVLIDAMECTPSFFRYQFQTLFQSFTQGLLGQHILGLAYDAADKGRAKGELQRVVESFVSLELIRKVAQLQPELVVCTHFLPAQVLSELRNASGDKGGMLRGNRAVQAQARALPLCLVLTDLDLQYMWVNAVDHYFVPRETAVHMLEAYGGLKDGAKATVSGIPIFPAFVEKAKEARHWAAPTNRAARLRELEALALWEGQVLGGGKTDGKWPLADDPRPVVLYISSGNAVESIYELLLASTTPLRVIVCTGRQADVRKALSTVAVPQRHVVKMLGFVADKEDGPTPGGMPRLLRCADLFVGKSGGLAVAEAAALCVPMIVLDPIPGQEQRNCDVLLEAGAAVKINDLPLLPRRVDEILGGGTWQSLAGTKAKAMAEAIGKLGKPDAAFQIADAVIERKIVPIYAPKKEE